MHPEAKYLIDYALPTLYRARTEVARKTLLDTVFNEFDYQVDCHSYVDDTHQVLTTFDNPLKPFLIQFHNSSPERNTANNFAMINVL